jgi:DNA polymerase-3 subunit epsilon
MDVSEGLDADDAVRQLLDFIGGRPLVGYYLEYDVAVLNKYVRGITGISLPNRQIEVSGRYYDYKFKQNPGAYIDLRLAELIADLQVPALPRHDALNDAITAGICFIWRSETARLWLIICCRREMQKPGRSRVCLACLL